METRRIQEVTMAYNELLGKAGSFLGAYYKESFPAFKSTLDSLYQTELKYPSSDYKTKWINTIKSSF
jgi:hypothetical protein